MTEPLTTGRLRLEPWDHDAHSHDLAGMNTDAEVMRYVTAAGPLTLEESRAQSERFAEHWISYGFGLWAVIERATGRMVGFAGLSHPLWMTGYEDAVEVGWRLHRDAWGHGYATEAGRAAVAYGFEELQLLEIVSLIHAENERSVAVATRLGLTRRELVAHPHRAGERIAVYAGRR